MASQTAAGFSNILKHRYTPFSFQQSLFKNNTLLGLLPKYEGFDGKNMNLANVYAPTGGISGAFANAQANKTPTTAAGFVITRTKLYSLFSFDTEVLLASMNDSGALKRVMDVEVNGAKNSFAKILGLGIYRNFGGALGQVGSTSTTTLTLSNKHDAFNFEVNWYVDSSATDGTSGSADAGPKKITAIDRQAGTLSAATNWTSASDFSDNDYVFLDGQFGVNVHGMSSWIPSTAPTVGGGDSHFGVDRSADADRLAGVRIVADVSNDQTIENTLVRAANEVELMGGAPDYVFMHPRDRRILINEQNSKTTHYKEVSAQSAKGAMANISYRSMMLEASSSELKILGDRNCPRGEAWMLTLEDWVLASLGSCPRFLNFDNHDVLREGSDDAYEGRLGAYLNLGCKHPGGSARIDLTDLPAVAADLAL